MSRPVPPPPADPYFTRLLEAFRACALCLDLIPRTDPRFRLWVDEYNAAGDKLAHHLAAHPMTRRPGRPGEWVDGVGVMVPPS